MCNAFVLPVLVIKFLHYRVSTPFSASCFRVGQITLEIAYSCRIRCLPGLLLPCHSPYSRPIHRSFFSMYTFSKHRAFSVSLHCVRSVFHPTFYSHLAFSIGLLQLSLTMRCQVSQNQCARCVFFASIIR